MLETRGRDLLNAKLRPLGDHSQQWLATTLSIGQPSVSLWSRGLARPEPHHRLALSILWDIAEHAWLTDDEWGVVNKVRAIMGLAPAPPSDPSPPGKPRPPKAARAARPTPITGAAPRAGRRSPKAATARAA